MRSRWKILIPVWLASIAIGAAVAQSGHRAGDDPEQARLRCATRVSMALLGQSPDGELLAAEDPRAQVERLLADPAFVTNFARFVNSQLNDEPGEQPVEDASFFLARHVLQQGLPWRELFTGQFMVVPNPETGGPRAIVVDDPDGLGYFRSPAWMRRYAGNEEDGYRLVAAYRIQQNIIGLDLDGIDSVPDQDLSAAGRMAPACSGCHYDSYFALDKVAKILSRVQGEDDDMTFIPPDEGPQEILGGQMIANDAELVEALVDSTDFSFRTCRLAFQYLYGRNENTCEGPLFDRCIDAFEQTGKVQDAIRAVASDASFCE